MVDCLCCWLGTRCLLLHAISFGLFTWELIEVAWHLNVTLVFTFTWMVPCIADKGLCFQCFQIPKLHENISKAAALSQIVSHFQSHQIHREMEVAVNTKNSSDTAAKAVAVDFLTKMAYTPHPWASHIDSIPSHTFSLGQVKPISLLPLCLVYISLYMRLQITVYLYNFPD